jgi:REP element-mobilizing transposase RayT
MNMPRPIYPKTTYMISRRCTQRQFLLKPTPTTNNIICYCLAVAAKRTGVQVHAACAMSNHVHMVVTDLRGRLPEFLAYFHKYVAKAVNASLGRWENLWAAEQSSTVRLLEPDDVLAKTVYVLTNPVAARLVRSSRKWPGLWGYRKRHGQKVTRPSVFFRPNGPMPGEATLQFVPPPAFADLSQRQYENKVAEAVKEEEAKLRREAKAEGQSFLGERRVLAQGVTDTPASREPRRQLNPRVASRNKWRRVEALQRFKEFIDAYREAYHRWRQGVRRVVFPAGTYGLRLHASVAVATG